MFNDQLYDRVSQDLSLTNIFIGLKMPSSSTGTGSVENFVPKPDIEESWSLRAKLTSFTIVHNDFCLPDKTPLGKKTPSVTGRDCYTPSSMEMCTPFVKRSSTTSFLNKSRQRSVSGSSFSNEFMVETPCGKTLDKIEESFSQMNLDENCETKTEAISYHWYFCDVSVKGFRDPQVGTVSSDPFD